MCSSFFITMGGFSCVMQRFAPNLSFFFFECEEIEEELSKPDEDDMKDAFRAHVCVCVCVCDLTCAKDCSDLPKLKTS